MKSYRNSKWYNFSLLSILAVIFVWQLYGNVEELFIITTGEQTQGVVQVPMCGRDCGNSKRVSLKVQYSIPNGSTYVFEKFGGFIPYHRVGDSVKVYYSENDPQNATVFSLFNIVIPLLIVTLLLLTGLGMRAVLRERK